MILWVMSSITFKDGRVASRLSGASPLSACLDQVHDPGTAGHSKSGIANKTGEDMGDEPVALQSRHQGARARQIRGQ